MLLVENERCSYDDFVRVTMALNFLNFSLGHEEVGELVGGHKRSEEQEITQQQLSCLASARNSMIRASIDLLGLTFVSSVMAPLRINHVVTWHRKYINSPNLVIPSPKFYSIKD